MELSDEQKERILEEEKARLTEEQYRAHVRRELQGSAASAAFAPAPEVPSPLKAIFSGKVILCVVVIAVCAVVLAIGGPRRDSSEAPSNTSVATIQSRAGENSDRPSPPIPVPPAKLTTAQIAELATPYVVVVESYNDENQKMGQGSGYVFSADGVIITNYHVIRGASHLIVKAASQGEIKVKSVLGYNIATDVAALQIPASSFTSASPGAKRGRGLRTESAPDAKVGDHVVAIGAPLGLENTVSDGIVSVVRMTGDMQIIQTTAAISPGSSGGPLLNEYGKVIGLTTATIRNGQSVNLVLSSKHIVDLLSRRHPISLADMLSETEVTDSLPASAIPVKARSYVQFPFTVNGQQGATLEGRYAITGGRGGDVSVALLGPGGVVILNSGRVAGFGQFRQRLPRGQYAIMFDNRSATFSSKSVSPDLKLTYYK